MYSLEVKQTNKSVVLSTWWISYW